MVSPFSRIISGRFYFLLNKSLFCGSVGSERQTEIQTDRLIDRVFIRNGGGVGGGGGGGYKLPDKYNTV